MKKIITFNQKSNYFLVYLLSTFVGTYLISKILLFDIFPVLLPVSPFLCALLTAFASGFIGLMTYYTFRNAYASIRNVSSWR